MVLVEAFFLLPCNKYWIVLKTPYLNSWAAILNFFPGQEGHLEFKMASFIVRTLGTSRENINSDQPVLMNLAEIKMITQWALNLSSSIQSARIYYAVFGVASWSYGILAYISKMFNLISNYLILDQLSFGDRLITT